MVRDLWLESLMDTVQAYEILWVLAGAVAMITHFRSIGELRDERELQSNSGENGLLGYLVDTDVYVETGLLVVQAVFAVPAWISLFVVSPPSVPTIRRILTITFFMVGMVGLAGISVFMRVRRKEALRKARTKG